MQMGKYSDYALLLAPMIYMLRFAQAEDVVNLDEMAVNVERGEDTTVIKALQGEKRVKFSKHVNGLVTDLVEYGYLECE